ncbi:MAG: NAD/NADP octopine/nopaline dehydrogenase family protein [Anaerolineae bacterium]|nr:NAD/NADP octopine/nopaline dehydrogenase family protein [Anaerolineae bacterium]
MKTWPNVTICGCGSGGMAMAADLSLMGCRVNLYEVPAFAHTLDPIRANGGIHLTGRTFSGKTGLAVLNCITSDAEEALEGSDLVFINVPAMAIAPFLEQLAPHFNEGQVVVVTTGYWATLRHRDVLEMSGAFDRYVFAEMCIMPYLSAKIGPASVDIGNYKRALYISAWPAAGNDAAIARVRQVYPQTRLCKNVLELNFRPGNPGVHAQITIPKAAFFFERAQIFHFYGEVSLCGSKLTDAHDVERMAVAAAYDCQTDTWPADCGEIYELEGDSLYEQHGAPTDPHAQKWNHISEVERLLVEDICYSFLPMEELAAVVGIKTPVMTAMTEILAVFTGYDYRADGLTLADLGLDGLDRDQIIEFVTTGRRV